MSGKHSLALKQGVVISPRRFDVRWTIQVGFVMVDLVAPSVTELGFFGEIQGEDVYRAALGFGLQLCRGDVFEKLKMQYSPGPREWLHVMTGESGSVRLVHDIISRGPGNVQLTSRRANMRQVWLIGSKFVFEQPR